MDAAISTLTHGLREAAILCLLNDLSISEAALQAGISNGAMKVRLHRARMRLQQCLLLSLVDYGFEGYLSNWSQRMIPVQILDIVSDEENDTVRLLLTDEDDSVLPIYVDKVQGIPIAVGIKKTAPISQP